jgi:hypothetical protein
LNTTEVEQATTKRNDAKKRRDDLREEDARLIGLIDAAADAAKSGSKADNSLVTLAGEVSAVRQQLRAAEAELEVADRELQAATTASQYARFDELAIEARKTKAAFVESYRNASLSLGAFCVASQELDQLTRSLGLNLAARLPTFHAAEEASALPDPRAGFLVPEGKHEVWRGWNYQLSFYVSPVVPSTPQSEQGEK